MKEKRYFIQLAYKGTLFHGWQIQPNNTHTVQESLEKALSLILREKIHLTGAGRTDAGVHASFFVAHFDSEKLESYGTQQLCFKLNRFFPQDILISTIFPVNKSANARFDALSRTYKYFISQEKQIYFQDLVTIHHTELDYALMNQATLLLQQYDDFKSFSRSHNSAKTSICHISFAQWEKQNNLSVFTITADRFLRNMVRAIVGTLLDVGEKKITIRQFQSIIEDQNRCAAGSSAPAHGLYLSDIRYPKEIDELLIRSNIGFNI